MNITVSMAVHIEAMEYLCAVWGHEMQVQKLSAAVAAAERRASKATKKAATLGKLLTREHSLRVAAEAAHEQALAHLTAPPAGDHDTAEEQSEHVASGAARAQTPTTAAARKLSSSRVLLTAVSPSQSNTMPFVRQMEAAVQEASPATGAGRMSGDSRAMARLQSLCLSPQVAQERARPSPTAMKVMTHRPSNSQDLFLQSPLTRRHKLLSLFTSSEGGEKRLILCRRLLTIGGILQCTD
jgi:hypothetical protein